jgi:hypothetical protein
MAVVQLVFARLFVCLYFLASSVLSFGMAVQLTKINQNSLSHKYIRIHKYVYTHADFYIHLHIHTYMHAGSDHS